MARSARQNPPAARAAACLAAGVLGLGLIALSLPRLGAGLDLLIGNAIQESYSRQRVDPVIADADLEQWRQSRLDALEWVDSGTLYYELADIELIAARQTGPIEDLDRLEAARTDLLAALERAPANGRGWLMLAVLNAQLSQPPEAVTASLDASLRTAPYDQRLLGLRLSLGFMYWESADPGLRAMLLAQVGNFAPARQLDVLQRIARQFPARVDDLLAALDPQDAVTREALEAAQTSG